MSYSEEKHILVHLGVKLTIGFMKPKCCILPGMSASGTGVSFVGGIQMFKQCVNFMHNTQSKVLAGFIWLLLKEFTTRISQHYIMSFLQITGSFFKLVPPSLLRSYSITLRKYLLGQDKFKKSLSIFGGDQSKKTSCMQHVFQNPTVSGKFLFQR